MKKTIFILSSIILTGIGFDGCKKGPDDPFLSLHTRKGRLTAVWAISSGTSTSTTTSSSGSSTLTDTWTATSLTETSSAPAYTVVGTNARYNMTIVKDGTWKLDEGYTVVSGTSSIITNITQSGTWDWLHGVGKDHKNREQIVLRTLSSNKLQGTTTTIETYTGDDAPSQVWELDELKSKELIVTTTGTAFDGTTTTNDKGTMTFAKSK